MHYALPQHLTFCRAGKGLVFLDTKRDRYFRLSGQLEDGFIALLEEPASPGTGPANLVERGILVPSPEPAHIATPSVPVASRSAIEGAPIQGRVPTGMFLDVLSSVCLMRLQLARRNLDAILDALVRHRGRMAIETAAITDSVEVERLLLTAHRFWRARAYVPIQPRCLLDSLAMVKVLASRRLYANLVFGITDDPFTAHAWVQAGDIVLSDTVGHAAAHAPIRVV